MKKLSLTMILLWSALSFAQGGPPMVTDDPGTPGNGHWEINFAGLLAASSDQTVLQLPYLDLNYGLGERTQLKVETGLVTVFGSPPTRTGAGTALIGVKYRFFDEETTGVAISTYPQIQFRDFISSQDPEISPAGNQYVLPFEFSKTFGGWEVNPEIGYLYGTSTSNEIFFGTVLAFEIAKPWEPLAEIHVDTDLDGTGTTVLLNFGFRYSFNSMMNLLAAAGHTVTHTEGSPLQFNGYLGLQLEL